MFNFLDTPPTLKVGDLAPDFELLDCEGQRFNLYEHLANRWVVLFFYPKDHTPGCTAEVCAFRDIHDEFKTLGVVVRGISADTEPSHQRFTQSQKLPYPLLSDPDGQVARAFGIQKTFGLLPGRVTFVIAPDRTIRLAYASQFKPESHPQQALAVLKSQAIK